LKKDGRKKKFSRNCEKPIVRHQGEQMNIIQSNTKFYLLIEVVHAVQTDGAL